eukprot:21347-Heterococcus_DN1.PRE.1
MARKGTHRKRQQETTLVPHRTVNLNDLLARAESGASALAVKAYLDAGGSADVLVNSGDAVAMQRLPLLHHMVLYNAHPHTELTESVRLLVVAGADINATSGPDGNERTVLMCASERSCCVKALQITLQNGADVLVSAADGTTALHLAAAAGRSDSCVLLLARAGSLVHIKNVIGCTAIMQAVAFGSLDTVKILCQYGADINILNAHSVTPLIAACVYKRADIVAYLIEAGADVNAVDCDGHRPLVIAVQNNSSVLVQLLIDQGADIATTDAAGRNAMFAAAAAGLVLMLELLVQCGLSITAADNTGTTLLMTAAVGGRKPAAEWLLQHGAAVNAVDIEGCTALHCASMNCCDDAAMVALLLASGADVHTRSLRHQTALDVAAGEGRIECARALIAAGADINNTDSNGITNLHLAVQASHSAVAQLLLEHGATAVLNNVVSVSCCCSSLTALMLCTEADTLKLLLAAGADVRITTDAGDTCLHKAAAHGCVAPVVCLFIKAGVDLHAVNSKGQTAAQVAHDRGFKLTEQLNNLQPDNSSSCSNSNSSVSCCFCSINVSIDTSVAAIAVAVVVSS